MSTLSLFKWRHFLPKIILLNVRWYCRYPLSYRDLEEMMLERGVEVDHSTLKRWLLKYATELDKRIRPVLLQTNDSWRVDETDIKRLRAVEVFVPRCRFPWQYPGLSAQCQA